MGFCVLPPAIILPFLVERCPAGKYYDDEAGLCRSCGHGFYQPNEGSFKCLLCGLGKTTRSTEAVSSDVSKIRETHLRIMSRSILQCSLVFISLNFSRRNVGTSATVECNWPPKASVNFVLVERTVLKAWSLPVRIAPSGELHPKQALLPSKNARFLFVHQVPI